MTDFINTYPEAQSMEKENKFVLRKLMKKYKLVLTNSIRAYQMTKTFTRTIFKNGKVMLMKKICTLRTGIIWRSLNTVSVNMKFKTQCFPSKKTV